MKPVFDLRRFLMALVSATLLQATSVSACELVHALDFKVESGKYELLVNDVFVSLDEGYSQGTRPLLGEDWLVEGDNTVTVNFLEEGGTPEATFAIVTGCLGEFPEGEPLASVTVDAPGTHVLGFTNGQPVDALHIRAEAAGDEGLAEAVARLQRAVEARDVETVIALHGPMMRDAERRGAPVDELRGMIGFLITQQEARLARDLVTTPAMEGRIHQVMTAEREPPVAIEVDQDGARFSWMTGVYWGRFDGEWGIVALFYP